ncbi:unnamed protein product, partial [Brachionus calyciflorus]
GNGVDLKAFNDEVAYAFLSTGNIEGLDELLRYLVDLECFTVQETLTFRFTLITIYQLINPHKSQNEVNNQPSKRNLDRFDYFNKINTLIDEIDFAYKNGNEKSIDLVKYLIEYIMLLEQTNELNNLQSNILLERIKEIFSKVDPDDLKQFHETEQNF